jgi:pentatricopeptide repeat protein
MKLLSQMEHEKCNKNEVTFSSAISTCEKTGQWQRAIDLLHQMKSEGIPQTAIAYNAAISACEKVRCFKSNQAKLPILYFFSQSIAILFLNRL